MVRFTQRQVRSVLVRESKTYGGQQQRRRFQIYTVPMLHERGQIRTEIGENCQRRGSEENVEEFIERSISGPRKKWIHILRSSLLRLISNS